MSPPWRGLSQSSIRDFKKGWNLLARNRPEFSEQVRGNSEGTSWPLWIERTHTCRFLSTGSPKRFYSSSGEANAMLFKASVWFKYRSKGFGQTLKTSSILLSQMGCSCDPLSGWLLYPGSFQEVQQHTAMAVTLLELLPSKAPNTSAY